ncbi:hypothetical protein C8R46DRAFT_382152 [Mycena filopes]|nr:hypothetical protein C8R46DRAFT_382152 [Mycena filopes]
MFFAWRVKMLTGNLWLTMIVVACALTGMAGGLATSIEVLLQPYFQDFIHFKSVVIVWLVAECVGDILITTILVTHLCSSHKTGMEGSDILIDRIIRLTVQTGLATALCATIDLILFLSDPIGFHLLFNIPLCKLYTNSLLSSLNARNAQGAGSAGSGQGLMASKRASLPAPPSEFRRSSVFIDVEPRRPSAVEVDGPPQVVV